MFAKRIRNYLGLILFLSLPSFLHPAELEQQTIRDFTKGLQSRRDATVVDNGGATALRNVDLKNGSIDTRFGSYLQNPTPIQSGQPIRFIHEFVDTTNRVWLLSISSNSLYVSDDGGVTNTLLTSTYGITSTSEFAAVNAFGKAYLMDGTTSCITWDGTSVSVATNVPKGSVIDFYGERLFVGGVVGDVSSLYASANGDPTDFTDNGVVDSDSFVEMIRENDGYGIRGIKKYRQGIMVFKDYSTDYVTLDSDGLTPIITPLSSSYGCQHPRTIQERDNDIVWLSPDGWYSFNGTMLTPLSTDIRELDDMQQLRSVSRYFQQTLQNDFTAGTLTDLSATISAGDVVLTTWSAVDTSSTNFASGTLSGCNITSIVDSVQMDCTPKNITDNSFENGSSFWAAMGLWERVNMGQGITLPKNGTYYYWCVSGAENNVTVAVVDVGGRIYYESQEACSPQASWTEHTINFGSLGIQGKRVYVKFTGTADAIYRLISDPFIASGGTFSFWACYTPAGYYGLPSAYIRIDYLTGGVMTETSSIFTSQIFDTGTSTSAWLTSTQSYTLNGNTIAWQTRTSTSNTGGWGTWTDMTTGGVPTTDPKRYFQYKATMTMNSSTANGLPSIQDVTFGRRTTSGYYLSPSINTSAATSHDLFQQNSSNDGGNITFHLYTDTNTALTIADPTTFISSQTIVSGQTPSIATNTYVRLGSTFTVTLGTQNPTLEDWSYSWNEGETNFPMASIYWDRDYYCAVSLSSTTGNDSIMVLDENNAWSIYDGLPAYSMCKYRNRPYIGANDDGDIIRFQADDLITDYDGDAINAYWESKEFDFGYPIADKTMTRYYVIGKRYNNADATFEYTVNRATTTTSVSLDLDSLGGFYRKNIVPPSTTYNKGITHRFKISSNGVDDRFSILGITLKARLETEP